MCRKVIWDQVAKVGVRPRANRMINTYILEGLDSQWSREVCILSYHHPVPTPRSSPSLVLGTSAFLSCAWGMV